MGLAHFRLGLPSLKCFLMLVTELKALEGQGFFCLGKVEGLDHSPGPKPFAAQALPGVSPCSCACQSQREEMQMGGGLDPPPASELAEKHLALGTGQGPLK